MKQEAIETIVVGVDLSPYSKKVVEEARVLAKNLKAKLMFAYVFPEANLFTESFEIRKPYVTQFYEAELKAFYKLTKNEKSFICYGKPYEQIIATAKKFKNPMIVIGHRGHNAIGRFFLGSNAEELVHNTPFPTWVHKGSKTELPKKILIPCDLTKNSVHTMKGLMPLQKLMKTETEFYHVMQEPIPTLDFDSYSNTFKTLTADDEKKVRAFRKKYPNLKTAVALGNIGSKISDYSKKFDAIAISPKPRTKFSKLIGGITETVLRSGNTPVLVIP
jgi:nucleotide-binding universal stress UspA family protein